MALKHLVIVSTLENTNLKKWTVYRHIAPNGKVYVGITSRSPQIRWGNNGYYYRGSVFVNAIKKYGWDNIEHEILFTGLSEELAKELEIAYIKYYKSQNRTYNMTDGGDGTVGYKPSLETRKKISEIQKNRDNSKYAAILNANRETIAIKHKKPVIQFSINGEFIKDYSAVTEAASILNIDPTLISGCCKKKLYKTNGYLWMYKSDYDFYKKNGTLELVLNEMVKIAKIPLGGYTRTKEWCNRHSALLKGKDYRSPKTKQRMTQRSVETLSKPVLQLTVDDIPIAVFKNGRSVTKEKGYSNGYISLCCNGKKENAYGYKWKYITKEDYNNYKTLLAS